MSSSPDDKKSRHARSLILVLLAWAFIGGQGLLTAGSISNHRAAAVNPEDEATQAAASWTLIRQGADRVRLVAIQAQPDVIGKVAVFLAIVNAVGLGALTLGLLSWSRSGHTRGKLTIAVSVTVILINTLLNLPYV